LGLNESRPTAAAQTTHGKIRWIDDVVAALADLGGGGHYRDIYEAVRNRRVHAGRSVPRSFNNVVRKEIEINSSDSDAFEGRQDLFHAPFGLGAGYWELRKK